MFGTGEPHVEQKLERKPASIEYFVMNSSHAVHTRSLLFTNVAVLDELPVAFRHNKQWS